MSVPKKGNYLWHYVSEEGGNGFQRIVSDVDEKSYYETGLERWKNRSLRLVSDNKGNWDQSHKDYKKTFVSLVSEERKMASWNYFINSISLRLISEKTANISGRQVCNTLRDTMS